jgi:hypothetical protein
LPKGKNGGRRPGAGRPKTRDTPAGKQAQELTLKAWREGTTPLQLMLDTVKDIYEKEGGKAAFPYAKECAPYIHPKLTAVDAKIGGQVGVYEAQPIPVETRDSDSLESAKRPPANGHSS